MKKTIVIPNSFLPLAAAVAAGVGVQGTQFANAFNETQTNIASALKFLDAGDLTAYLNPATVKPAALPV